MRALELAERADEALAVAAPVRFRLRVEERAGLVDPAPAGVALDPGLGDVLVELALDEVALVPEARGGRGLAVVRGRRDDGLEPQVALVAPEPRPVARHVVVLVAAHALAAGAAADQRRRLEREALVAAEHALLARAEAALVVVRRLGLARAALEGALQVRVEVAAHGHGRRVDRVPRRVVGGRVLEDEAHLCGIQIFNPTSM